MGTWSRLIDFQPAVYEFKGKPIMSQPAPPPPPSQLGWPKPPPPPPQAAGSGLQCPVCQRQLPWVSNERQLNLHFLEHEEPKPAAKATITAVPPSQSRKQLTDSDLARQIAEELAEEDADLQRAAASSLANPGPPAAPLGQPYKPPVYKGAGVAFPPQPFVRPVSPSIGGSPFAVKCPYPGCGMPNMEAFMFPQHVVMWHTSAITHNYACPVCALDASIPPFQPNAKTNLMQHARSIHADLLTANLPQPLPLPQPYAQPVPSLQNLNAYSGFFGAAQPSPAVPAAPFSFGVSKQVPPPPPPYGAYWTPAKPPAPNMHAQVPAMAVAPVTIHKPYPKQHPAAAPDPVQLGGIAQFLEDTLLADIPSQECMICMEEFRKVQVILRLDCMCMYHKTCIHAWWSKGRRDCPLHKKE